MKPVHVFGYLLVPAAPDPELIPVPPPIGVPFPVLMPVPELLFMPVPVEDPMLPVALPVEPEPMPPVVDLRVAMPMELELPPSFCKVDVPFPAPVLPCGDAAVPADPELMPEPDIELPEAVWAKEGAMARTPAEATRTAAAVAILNFMNVSDRLNERSS